MRSSSLHSLVPIRSRSRGERRSLRTFPGVSLRPPLAFNPRHRRLSTPPLTPFDSTPTSTLAEPRETLGILLQPAAASFDDVASELVLGDVYKGVVIVTGGEGGAKGIREGNERDEDGYGVEVVTYDAFESDVAAGARALPMEYNLPPVVKEE